MAGRGPQSFKKKQKEQARKEKQQEKAAKRLEKKQRGPGPETEEVFEPFDPADAGILPDSVYDGEADRV